MHEVLPHSDPKKVGGDVNEDGYVDVSGYINEDVTEDTNEDFDENLSGYGNNDVNKVVNDTVTHEVPTVKKFPRKNK